jgi:hypothetical protein
MDEVDRDGFVRDYNRRRLWAKISAFTVIVCWGGEFTYEHLTHSWPSGHGESVIFWGSLAIYIWANLIRGHCPFCGRFIGAGFGSLSRLPRGMACELEHELSSRLDLPAGEA